MITLYHIVDCAELKDLVNELQSVTEWFRLGMNLDIPHVKLMQLHHDYKHIAECLLHMLMEWGKRERRTWSKVVRALAAIGRTLLAQELARKYGKFGALFTSKQTNNILFCI